MCRYNSSSRHYDAFFLQTLPPNLTAASTAAARAAGAGAVPGGWAGPAERYGTDPAAELRYSVLANQTAIHGLPAALTQVRWLLRQGGSQQAADDCQCQLKNCCVLRILPLATAATAAHFSASCSLSPPPPSQAHAALLRWVTGDAGADIQLATHPLPVLADEQDMKITEAAGGASRAVCMPACLFACPACQPGLPACLLWVASSGASAYLKTSASC